MSQGDWQRIVERARDDALTGDRHAREWLAKMLGLEPPARVAATDPDGGPVTFMHLLAASAKLTAAPMPPPEPEMVELERLMNIPLPESAE